jgi:hypothetical protein
LKEEGKHQECIRNELAYEGEGEIGGGKTSEKGTKKAVSCFFF